MELHLKVIGVLLLLLGLIHGIFPKYFNWEAELRSVSLINKQMMYVHTFFIALFLMLTGALCISSSNEMIETPFGRSVALGLGIFWLARLVIQFFGYSSNLWRGKTFETVMHIMFAILWTYMTAIFMAVYWTRGIP